MSRTSFPPLRLLLVAFLVAFGGTFQYGYQSAVINPSADIFASALNESFQRRFNRSMSSVEFTWFWTIAVNVLNGGGVLGVILVSLVAERFGRRNAILLADVPSLLGTLLLGVWPVSGLFELLIVGRFLIGVHCGLSSGLQPLYLTEISIPEYSGVLNSFTSLALLSMVVLGAIVGLPVVLGNVSGFLFLLLMPAIPSVIHLIGMLFLHETPQYLFLTAGNRPKAEKALRFFNGAEANVDHLIERIRKVDEDAKAEVEEIDDDSTHGKYGCGSLKMPSTIWFAALVACVAAAVEPFTGIDALENFSTSIFVAAGVDAKPAKLLTVVQVTVVAISVLISMAFIDRVNRRRLLLSMTIGCCVCNCAFVAIAEVTAHSSICAGGNCAAPLTYAIGVVYILHSGFYGCGVGQIPWFLASEMVPQAYRSQSQTISTSMLWVLTILSGVIFFPLSESSIGSFAVLIVFVVPSILCVLFLLLFMPETRGREVTEVLIELEKRRAKFLNRGCRQRRKFSSATEMTPTTTYRTFENLDEIESSTGTLKSSHNFLDSH